MRKYIARLLKMYGYKQVFESVLADNFGEHLVENATETGFMEMHG